VKLTRTHARALATGAATTVLYLAGSKAAASPRVKVGSLFLLAATAVVGLQPISQDRNTKKRLESHIAATSAAVHFVATNGSVLTTLANANDPTFLAGMIGPIANQTTANATISTVAGSMTTSERTAFNGLVNAVNNLQSHLQSANIEA
jgi:hypothetical protein